MHLQDTSHTLLLVLGGIQHIGTGVQSAGIYAEIRKSSYKRIGNDLEHKSGKRLFIRRMPHDLIAVQICTGDVRNICRSRHVFNHGIQQLLDTLVLMG